GESMPPQTLSEAMKTTKFGCGAAQFVGTPLVRSLPPEAPALMFSESMTVKLEPSAMVAIVCDWFQGMRPESQPTNIRPVRFEAFMPQSRGRVQVARSPRLRVS